MALNTDLQILTQPGAIGQQTYNLPAGFDPKAIMLWAVPATADGLIAHTSFGVGFGTYRGAAVQQGYTCFRGLDGALSADTARGAGTNACLVLLTDSAGSAARDLEIDLISMTNSGTPNVVLDWANLHSTASIRIYMLVLGGSDITDAVVQSQSLSGTNFDFNLPSGFGQPDFCLWASGYYAGSAGGDAASHASFGFGFGKKGEAGRGFGHWQTDGNTASLCRDTQRSDRCILAMASATSNADFAQMDTTLGNWPTDGIRLILDATSLGAYVHCLALKGTFQATTGSRVSPIAGGAALTQDNDCGFPPKLGFQFGWDLVSTTTVQTADAAQIGFGIGAYDGATEAWAGFSEDDAAGTMVSKSRQNAAKAHDIINQLGTSLHSADGSFSGNNYRLVWNVQIAAGREYQWFGLGDGVSAAEYTDSATILLALTPSSTELHTTFDSATITLLLAPSSTDVEAATDTSTVPLVFSPSAIEGQVYTDANTAEIVFTPSATEVHGKEYVDTGTATLAFTPSATETTQAVDSSTATLTFTASGTETKTQYDAETVTLVLTPSAADVQVAVDSNTSLLIFTVSATETKVLSDADIALLALTPSGTETREGSAQDSATIPLSLVPTSVEVFEGTDSDIAILTFTASGTELRTQFDSNTVPLALTPSSTDILQAVDQDVALLLLTPSGTEIKAGTGQDADTAFVILIPNSLEAAQFTDVATALLVFTPSATEEASTGYVDSDTAQIRFTPTGVITSQFVEAEQAEIRFTPSAQEGTISSDNAVASLRFEASGEEQLTSVDSQTIPLTFTPAGSEIRFITDADTVPLTFTPSHTSTSTTTDFETSFITFTPSGVEGGNVDVGTVYFRLTPSTKLELWIFFDVSLDATLIRHYVGDLLERTWTGDSFTQWDGKLNRRLWKGKLMKRLWKGKGSNHYKAKAYNS